MTPHPGSRDLPPRPEQYNIVPVNHTATPDKGLPARAHVASLCRPDAQGRCTGGACCNTSTVTVGGR